MISSAFARSRPLMARYDVSPHMVKWWKAVRPDDGQVRSGFIVSEARRRCDICISESNARHLWITRHVSPYEQQIIVPWIKTWPKRAWAKFSDSGPYLIGTFMIVYGTVVGAEAADKAQDHSYRY
ncbi:hypothetical protein ACHAXA_003111 [Cyclostephanos tholiformis]|uniref:NADH dehydrogenase [ubiquinone] 1 beta subcomplex subunit 3 n=1 Tax=Cyclostephanos tholiformis TaxID=382380 RepID=A0ABD3ST36_9STRA